MAVQSGVYRGQSAQERVSERRRRLMDATLEVWADPARRTTMTAISTEAGLTERYFYESFAHLDEALQAVLESIADEIERTCTAAAEAAGDAPRDRAYASIRAFVGLLLEDPRKGRVAIIEAVSTPQLRQRRTELLRHLAHRSAEEARDHFGRSRDDELAGLLFIGGMAELITSWLDGTLQATPDQIVEAAARAFLGLYS